MCECMYVGMYVCICMYVCRYVFMDVCLSFVDACMYLCMYVLMYLCIRHVCNKGICVCITGQADSQPVRE